MQITKKYIKVTLINITVIFVSLVILEVISKIIYDQYFAIKVAPKKEVSSVGDDLKQNLKTPQIVDEGCENNPIINNQITNLPEYFRKNIQCGDETIEHGLRKTVDQPVSTESKNLYFLGGSTVWGSSVADADTIPSQLQVRLNASGLNYKVHNLGFSSLVISQQLQRLKMVDLNSGDIVVFYDGGNDLWQGMIYGNPKGTIIGYNNQNWLAIKIHNIKKKLHQNSNLYKLFYSLRWKIKKDPILNCTQLTGNQVSERAHKTFENYKQSILDARQYTIEKNAKFFHFYQPTLISSTKMDSDTIKNIIELSPELLCALHPLDEGNQFLRSANQKFINNRNYNFDLSQTLIGHQNEFIDWIHVGPNGNRLISNEIYEILKKNF